MITGELLSEIITAKIGDRFRTFGGGKDSDFNPITKALKDSPMQFAAGVSVSEVVNFIAFEVLDVLSKEMDAQIDINQKVGE